MTAPIHKVLLVHDRKSGLEAIYLDGKLVFEEVTAYAMLKDDRKFPEDASELELIEE
jgi:hypothetical protein